MSRKYPRRLTRRAVILVVLEASHARGWDDETLADVLAAQLAESRLARGIVGPCAYCGTWVASTVDHVVPVSAGGTNAADNLASACLVCNSGKADRTAEQWMAALSQRRILPATPALLAELRA